MLMKPPVGRRIDIDIATRTGDSHHLQEGDPKHRIVLETRCRDDRIKFLIRERQYVGIPKDDVDPWARNHINAHIVDCGRRDGSEGAIDVQGAYVQHQCFNCGKIRVEEYPAKFTCCVVHRLPLIL